MEQSFFENRMQGGMKSRAVAVYDNENFSFRAHWHQEIELIHVREGSVVIGVNKEVRRLTAGDLCLVCSGDIHYYESCPEGSRLVTILVRADLVRDFYDWVERNLGASQFLTEDGVREHGLAAIYELSDRMCKESVEEQPGYEDANKACAALLLIEIMRKWPCRTGGGQKPKPMAGQKQIQDILAYMEQHVEEPLTMAGLAEQFHMDSFYLSKVFNHVTGMHFKNYLNRMRVALAEEKLVSGRQPILDIAYECGFGSVRNFNRTFKEIKGRTPGEIRAESAKHKR